MRLEYIMKELKDHTGRMNYYLRRFVLDAFKISLLNPERAWFLFETLIFQWLASRRRTKKNSKNCLIPPYMIISITGQCNLKCQGCYAQVHNAKRNGELTIPEWEKLLDEAGELGVSVALVAGGEPLSRPEFFDMLKTRKSMLFPVFTNGLLIDDPYIEKFRSQPNLIPVVSVEGLQDQTDGRRGEGVFLEVKNALARLNSAKIFHGISITVTRKNFDSVTSDAFVRSFIKDGCSLFFFIEYTPIDEKSMELVLTEQQRDAMHVLTDSFRLIYKGLFVTFPGDEREYDGCLASGRGFFHVASDGSLEPCPFAPYSDRNIRDMSLKEALASPLLSAIRKNHKHLEESGGGCTLWNNREWVNSLVKTPSNK
jgi:MoaA/NifB/PqqE/SkfB family radical SAM enzyme